MQRFLGTEGRDSIYRVASRLVEDSWGDTASVADALTVLLLVRNQAFYRYGDLDSDRIEAFLAGNAKTLERLRRGELARFRSADDATTALLFTGFMEASAAVGKKDRVFRYSPVSAAKGLHLLSPRLFPLWDAAIARAYGCRWYGPGQAATAYRKFMDRMEEVLNDLSVDAPLDQIERDLCDRARFPKPLLQVHR